MAHVFTCVVYELDLSTAQVDKWHEPCMINELALSTEQGGSMVFTCMVIYNELALSTEQGESMVFTCMVNELALSTAHVAWYLHVWLIEWHC